MIKAFLQQRGGKSTGESTGSQVPDPPNRANVDTFPAIETERTEKPVRNRRMHANMKPISKQPRSEREKIEDKKRFNHASRNHVALGGGSVSRIHPVYTRDMSPSEVLSMKLRS